MGGSGNGMKRIILIAFAVFLLTNGVFAAEVKNLVSKQVGNRVLFEFDVIGEEVETDVTITLRINDKTYTAKDLHLEGDYGKIKVGRGRKIYWNVLQDFPRGYSGDLAAEIVAQTMIPSSMGGDTFIGRVLARVSNADDKAVMYVNNREVIAIRWGKGQGGKRIGHRPGDSGWIDISPYMVKGENTFRFWVWNKRICCSVSGTFEVKVNGVSTITRKFAQKDSSEGVKYDETVRLNLPLSEQKEIDRDSGDVDVGIVTSGVASVYENALRGVRVRNLTPDIYKKLDISEEIKGVVVTKIESGSPASKKFSEKKLLASDVIMAINRKAISNIEDYEVVVSKIKPYNHVLLLVHRRGSALFMVLSDK